MSVLTNKEIGPGWHTLKVMGTYDEDQEGNPHATPSGKPYTKVLLQSERGGTFKESFFRTEAAAWRIEKICELTGAESLEETLGLSIRGKVEIDDGWPRLVAMAKNNPRVAQEGPGEAEGGQDGPEESSESTKALDDDLNEDVPF